MLLPEACAGIQTQEQGGWKDDLILALSIKAQSLQFHFLRGWVDVHRIELAHNYTVEMTIPNVRQEASVVHYIMFNCEDEYETTGMHMFQGSNKHGDLTSCL